MAKGSSRNRKEMIFFFKGNLDSQKGRKIIMNKYVEEKDAEEEEREEREEKGEEEERDERE